MSRVQLALNVSDIDGAVAFYSKLFAVEPAKVRPGYVNFAIADPPLKLVLIESEDGADGSLNHLGVEVESTREVAQTQARLTASGLPTQAEDNVSCCYALQDKVWVAGRGGRAWEIFTVLSDADVEPGTLSGPVSDEAACCDSRSDLAGAGSAASRC